MNKKLMSLFLSFFMSVNIAAPAISYAAEIADTVEINPITSAEDSSQTATEQSIAQNPTDDQISVEDKNSTDEFEIVDGVLVKYNGTDANVVIPEGVTTIGENVFSYNRDIKSVVIPEGVTTIEKRAFESSDLVSVKLPESLTTIGDEAFRYADIENLVLPKNLTYIGEGAFDSCPLQAELVIPDGVSALYNYTFDGCRNLKTVKLPDTMTWIGSHAFSFCTQLETINIPKDLTLLGPSAFWVCHNLDCDIVIPDGVTEIYSMTFGDCYKLSSVTLPKNLTTIDKYAFESCYALKNITIPESVTTIKEYAFRNCNSLESISIPKNVSTINEETFSSCDSLKSVEFSEGLKQINKDAFENCFALKSIELPEGFLYLKSRAFENCSALESVSMPESMILSEKDAFLKCNALENVYVYSKNVELQENTFPRPHDNMLTLYGYTGSTAQRYVRSMLSSYPKEKIRFLEIKEDSEPPQKVTNLKVASKTSSKVQLSWDKVEDCSGYEIYRYSASEKRYKLIKTLNGADTTTYTDTNKLSATIYKYKIRAFKVLPQETVYSEDSDVLKVTTKPLTPSITGSSATTSTVTFSWKDVSRENGYEIYRLNPTTGQYTLINTVDANTTTYTDRNRISSTAYTYKVRAFRTVDGQRVYSNYSIKVSQLTKPLTPKVTLSSTTSGKIKISWTNCSKNATGYKIYMATSKTGTYKLIKTTSNKSYTKSYLTPGKTYYFKVRAYTSIIDIDVYGNYSTVKYIKCK